MPALPSIDKRETQMTSDELIQQIEQATDPADLFSDEAFADAAALRRGDPASRPDSQSRCRSNRCLSAITVLTRRGASPFAISARHSAHHHAAARLSA
ncbi:MAG: hypothetical protein C0183_13065 [Roseiflexus castenholzii]|nr:MAG: hypothetical protein C0183_13065 [Roseiflexus castenholzii]